MQMQNMNVPCKNRADSNFCYSLFKSENIVGKTAAEIAGIVRTGIAFAYFAKNKTVPELLEKMAGNVGFTAFPVRWDEGLLKNCHEKNIDFSYYSEYYGYSTFYLSGSA